MSIAQHKKGRPESRQPLQQIRTECATKRLPDFCEKRPLLDTIDYSAERLNIKGHGAMATLVTIRFDFEFGRLGPNKIALLETVAEIGSFRAAARAHNVSYRYAWRQIDEVNRLFTDPVVLAHRGGQKGGGVSVTDRGRRVVTLYREAEAKVRRAAQGEIDELERCLGPAKREHNESALPLSRLFASF